MTDPSDLGKQDFRFMEFAVSPPIRPNGNRDRIADDLPRVRASGKATEPGWASGLRQLYNSVLNEPLPDSFDDLLKKLDKGPDE